MTNIASILFSDKGIKSNSFNLDTFCLGTVTIPANWVIVDNVNDMFLANSLLFDSLLITFSLMDSTSLSLTG